MIPAMENEKWKMRNGKSVLCLLPTAYCLLSLCPLPTAWCGCLRLLLSRDERNHLTFFEGTTLRDAARVDDKLRAAGHLRQHPPQHSFVDIRHVYTRRREFRAQPRGSIRSPAIDVRINVENAALYY